MTLREPLNARHIAEWALVFVVTLSMLAYGLGKYWQFGQLHDTDQTVSELSGMQLMWAFYGYSKTFPILLGIAEVTGALLLLVPRTRILGALLLSILLVNIIIQDIIYGVHPGALFAACLYQLMLLFILGWHRKKLYQAWQSLLIQRSERPATSRKTLIWIISIAALLAFVLKYLEIFGTRAVLSGWN